MIVIYILIGVVIISILGGVVIAILFLRDINEQDRELEEKVNDSLKRGNRLN